MNDPRTLELVTAWRTAQDRSWHLKNRRWPWVRLIMWLIALVAVILLTLGSSALIPGALSVAALAVGGDHMMREMQAGIAKREAWEALAEHTGLNEAGLLRLVAGDEIGGAK